MINKDKITYNEPIYFVPSYCGVQKVSILRLKNNDIACVKGTSKKKELKPYNIPLVHIYNTDNAARVGRRSWENWKKKSKNNKQQLNGGNKKYSVVATNGQKYFFSGAQYEKITNARKWCKEMGYELLLYASNNPSGTFAIKDSDGEIVKKCYTVKQLQMYVKQHK